MNAITMKFGSWTQEAKQDLQKFLKVVTMAKKTLSRLIMVVDLKKDKILSYQLIFKSRKPYLLWSQSYSYFCHSVPTNGKLNERISKFEGRRFTVYVTLH